MGTRRDRDARVAATIARACGFEQPVAPLIVRRVADVEALLSRDDATVRRVLGDETLRGSVRTAVLRAFREVWKQAAMDRLRTEHPQWLRTWWLPVLTDAELDRLRRAPVPRADHRRVGLATSAFPTATGAAEVLADADHRRRVGDYLVVERRVATALHDLAAALATEEAGADGAAAVAVRDDVDVPPVGMDRDAAHGIAWWHA